MLAVSPEPIILLLLVEMMRFTQKLAGYLFPAFLVLISIYLCFKNYSSGTFLIGWDSLHPEFDFKLAFERIFWGVWRGEQGLGAIAAHAHMADLPRVIFLWLSSFVLPLNFLRYLYIFLCLIIGPLGVYFFLKYVFEREKEGTFVYISSFLGALYYLLNLSTLQHFLVPFEMFPTLFAFLPWLFLFALRFIREGRKKSLFFFSLFSFFALPLSYASSLYYAYFGSLTIFLFAYFLLSKAKFPLLKRVVAVLMVSLTLNAFWLLPNIYSVKNQAKAIEEAKINRLFSPEAFLRNYDHGNIKDVLTQKNFLFDWRVYDNQKATYVDLMGDWTAHLNKPEVAKMSLLFPALAILGMLIALFKKNKVALSLSLVTVFCLFFLVNANYQTGFIYSYLYDRFALFREGFRMPFTKFSTLFAFCLSFFLGYFLVNVLPLFRKSILKVFYIFIPFAIGLFLVYSMLPAFEGKLISRVVKKDISNEYFQLFSFFKGKEGRIAKFPMQTLWGWGNNSWGYEGSGFLTYGLKNPLLDRDFDRWNKANESFYLEASNALYAKDIKTLEKTLEKYEVKYLLLDESVINPGGSQKLLFNKELKEMIKVSQNIKELKTIGFLTVYETPWGKNQITVPETYIKTGMDMTLSQKDTLFEKYGDYLFEEGVNLFPFANMESLNLIVSKEGNYLLLVDSESQIKVILPIRDQTTEYFVGRGFKEATNCDLKKLGTVFKKVIEKGVVYRAEDNGVSCDFYDYPNLSYNQAYILRIKGENKEGRSLKIYLQNKTTGKMELEELLPKGNFDEYFFINPSNFEEKGYSLNLETRSFGNVSSENRLEVIEFIPVDYTFLADIKKTPNEPISITNNIKVNQVKQRGTFLYEVDLTGSGVISLNQSYDSGWLAFRETISKGNILKHTKINSWANAWYVPEGTNKVYLLYWPQGLEWAGGILGILNFF